MPIAVAETISELRTITAEARATGKRVALVPTMGALHAGHLALVQRASTIADVVIVSIFINPLQFGPSEDIDRYPRTLPDDLAQLEPFGVAAVFAPSVTEMYPSGASDTRVTAGRIGSLYEGRTRAGHFDGVLTVVSKLLNIARPDVVLFGQKDAQQVFLVKCMIVDLDLPIEVDVVPTVREHDGLALSSRNRFLDAKEKRAARGLSLALEAADSSADRGIDAVLAAAQSVLMGEHLVELDYLVIVDPGTFLPVDDGYQGRAVVLVAARVGTTRLIDNEEIFLTGIHS
ncbi:pantoate--beta-alanine ligase [Glaciihabitans sp. INWT7]|uniref:pantoate--beta-alanine ligase n=1 Tax=Glaciihabitans sp. INWT7 TaxID=2596912 RepID=UPI0016274D0C|nr:pantoate--beta-alanine ligase [Glaciihabitans sp. INWT7]QNE48028.1 pantoate--beta-alanine ligase [Glaciihabitans sp. INWT7]